MSLSVFYEILNQKDTPAIYADSLFFRPNFGFVGRLFIAIDTKQIFRDYGDRWELIADAGSGSSNLQQVTTNGNFTTTDIDMLSGNLILRNLNPGGVLFTNTSEIVSQDINNFFWDDTNNRLGIGTNTPTAPLDVHSTGNILQQLNGTSTNNTYLAFLNQDIGKWRIGNYYNSGDNDFVIYDTFSGVTRAFFTNTGYTIFPTNMIIGSSNRSSAYGLDSYVSANFQSTLRVQGATTFLSQINGNNAILSSTLFANDSITSSVSSGNGAFYINNASLTNKNWTLIPSSNAGETDLLYFYTGSGAGTKLIISNKGNLGLGATLSAWSNIFQLFQIGNNGGFLASRTDSINQIQLGVNGYFNGSTWIYTNTEFASKYYQASGSHFWESAPSGTAGTGITFTTLMNLKNNGNLLIGTTTDNGAKLRVNGTIEVIGSNPSNKNIRFVTCSGDGGGNQVQVYWNLIFGANAAGGCLGAYSSTGVYAAPSAFIPGSNTYTIYGYIGV